MIRVVVAVVLILSAPCVIRGADTLEQIFLNAAKALSFGNLAAAEAGFQAVLKQQPNHAGSLGNLGVVYMRMDRPADAVAVYRRALRAEPNDSGLLLNLGLAHLKLEDYASAKPLFERLVKASYSLNRTRELLATCQILTGEAQAGIETLTSLPPSAGILYLRGVAYLKLRDRAKAESSFRDLLTSAASPAQAQYLLGKAYYEAALLDEASAAFKKAADLEPALPGIHLELGKTYLGTRDGAAAERELRAALAAAPNDADAAYYLGALLVQESRHEEGIPLLERARSARPDGWGAYYYLGRAKLQTGQAGASVALFQKAAALNPQEPSIYYQLGRACQAAGRAAEAKQAYAKMRALRSQDLREEELNVLK